MTDFARRSRRRVRHDYFFMHDLFEQTMEFLETPSISPSCTETGPWSRWGDLMKYLNMIGPQVQRLRYARQWSQSVLAAKLQLLGWDIDRVSVAKIESRLIHVDDYKLLYFTKVFNVSLVDLFPKIDAGRRIHEALAELMQRRPSPSVSLKKLVLFETMDRL
jgi:transcriptional regulator with XRE-family HTH domain